MVPTRVLLYVKNIYTFVKMKRMYFWIIRKHSVRTSQKTQHISITKSNRLIVLSKKKKINSVALVRKRNIPTERPPSVGKVSANFCR
jgi:hypothetical protein